MNNERDELADHLADSIFRYTGVTTASSKSMADELLAAGYRKPQQVTTVEELDALPNESVILCHEAGDSMQKSPEGYWYFWGGDIGMESEEVNLPATVLHVGGDD